MLYSETLDALQSVAERTKCRLGSRARLDTILKAKNPRGHDVAKNSQGALLHGKSNATILEWSFRFAPVQLPRQGPGTRFHDISTKKGGENQYLGMETAMTTEKNDWLGRTWERVKPAKKAHSLARAPLASPAQPPKIL